MKLESKTGDDTFALFLDGLGFGDGETLHGLELLLRRLLLVRRRLGLAVGPRVHQHAAGERVALPVGRIPAAMIDWRKDILKRRKTEEVVNKIPKKQDGVSDLAS